MAATSRFDGSPSHPLHRLFEAVLPRIVRHARVYFRWIKCWHTKEDKIQEVRSHCWKWIKLLHKAKRKWWLFVSRLADYACRQVKSGRKVGGTISAKDVMNEITQARKGFYVGKLPDFSTESTNPLVEALTDNTVTPVDEQVAFRIDFPAWLGTLTPRERRIVKAMLRNERTKDLSKEFQLSEGRISQLRGEFLTGWKGFVGGEPVCCRRPLRRRKKRVRA